MILFGLLACSGTTEKSDTASEVETETVEEIDDLSWVNPADLPAGPNPCREPIRVFVENVIDGDTFVGQGEEEERVRIIGVNTPETNEGECYSQEAKSFLINQIFGKWVWLSFDSDCYDIYDRTLAYVHLGTGEQDFVERQILLGGYARAFPFDQTDTFEDIFEQDEATAKANNAGAWAECGWN